MGKLMRVGHGGRAKNCAPTSSFICPIHLSLPFLLRLLVFSFRPLPIPFCFFLPPSSCSSLSLISSSSLFPFSPPSFSSSFFLLPSSSSLHLLSSSSLFLLSLPPLFLFLLPLPFLFFLPPSSSPGLMMAEADKFCRRSESSDSSYHPTIFCGDMNALPYSHLYKFIQGKRLKYSGLQVGQVIRDRGPDESGFYSFIYSLIPPLPGRRDQWTDEHVHEGAKVVSFEAAFPGGDRRHRELSVRSSGR